MNTLISFAHKLLRHKWWVVFFLGLLTIHLTNTIHTAFPDEFDNIVGGWYITHGILPYTGFFSHHNPGAYYIAAIITLFTGQSFVAFRYVWAVVLFIWSLLGFLMIQKRIGSKYLCFYATFLFIWTISATYFWAQMLLSETVVTYMLVPVYGLILIKALKQHRVTLLDITLVSITSAIALLTSMTFFFAVVCLLAFLLYYFFAKDRKISRLLTAIGILAVPYILFGFYLLITGSVSEFYYGSVTYNREYYIYNFPTVSGQVNKNPARYALSIFYNTSMQFQSLLTQVNSFNFSYPVNITLLVGNVALLIYLLSKKKYALAVFVYFFLIYLNARAEPLTSKETDFHSTVYGAVSIFNIVFVLWQLIQDIRAEKDGFHQFLYKLLFAGCGLYAFFGGLYMVRSFTEKGYTKLMGQAPAIYDEPVAAPIINKLVSKDEYFWIGPFEFQELLYVNGKVASKYHWFLPASSRSEKITSELRQDLLTNKPKIVVFKEDYGTFGMTGPEFNGAIVSILREHYIQLGDFADELVTYRPVRRDLHNFDIQTNFYFDKNRKQEILDQLLSEQLIEPISP
ncbi:hypothetical protein C4564_00570 [Candidatus Microgenomates bacterium]|nr:MAG: hypothetical protein C4564_00570 [Candidatus Microgenomates bacterium]